MPWSNREPSSGALCCSPSTPVLAYVHIFKTAGTTLTGILRRNFSIRHLDTRLIQETPAITAAQLRRVRWLYPRLESIAGHAVRPYADLRSGFSGIRFYTFLRDPDQRLISAYTFQAGNQIRHGWRPETDAEIAKDMVDFLPQVGDQFCRALGGREASVAAAIDTIETRIGFVGLVEHFDESLAMLTRWIGRADFDPRYRRLNVSEGRSESERKYAPHREALGRVSAVVREMSLKPDIVERIAASHRGDRALYDHVRRETFPRMQRTCPVGGGPFAFERPAMPADTTIGWLYRDLVGRPLAPLVAGLRRRPG